MTRRLKHSKAFEAYGYSLERFSYSDTRRIEGEEIYRYYAAQGGRLVARFVDLAHACEWLEATTLGR